MRKLDQTVMAVLVAALAIGCSARASTHPVTTARTPVGSARLMAAELKGTDKTPRVGKSYRSEEESVSVDAAVEDDSKDVPHRSERKPGGGFSGYK